MSWEAVKIAYFKTVNIDLISVYICFITSKIIHQYAAIYAYLNNTNKPF